MRRTGDTDSLDPNRLYGVLLRPLKLRYSAFCCPLPRRMSFPQQIYTNIPPQSAQKECHGQAFRASLRGYRIIPFSSGFLIFAFLKDHRSFAITFLASFSGILRRAAHHAPAKAL
jgi:hypothetical protein